MQTNEPTEHVRVFSEFRRREQTKGTCPKPIPAIRWGWQGLLGVQEDLNVGASQKDK